MLKHLVAVLLLQLLGSSAFAQLADTMPPQLLRGEVNGADSKFSHGSDGDVCTWGSDYCIAHWVCNDHSDGLVFRWEKAKLFRTVFNPLPTGQCFVNERSISSDTTLVEDHEAPLLYTQASVEKDGSVYLIKSDKKEVTTLRSMLGTFDKDRQFVQGIIVTTSLDSETSQLEIEIETRGEANLIGLGAFDWVLSSDITKNSFFQQIKILQETGVYAELLPAYKRVNSNDFPYFSAAFEKDFVLFIDPKSQKVKIEFDVDPKKLKETESYMFIANSEGRIEQIGGFSTFGQIQ
jgi:hypothetical protein